MAKYRRHVPAKQESYPYPTRFGSHRSMVDEDKTADLDDDSKVVLQDEHGFYTTETVRLDNKLADPNRYTGSRLRWFV